MASFSLEDLINLQETKVSRDPSSYITYLYGEPKVGKTTFARDAGALIIACEDGTKAMSGAYRQVVKSWADIKAIVKYLKDPRLKEKYKAVAFDTVDIAANLCEKYICGQLEIETLGEGGWSKNGWAAFKKELTDVFNTISVEGYAIIFISHAKDKTITRPDGTEYNKIVPSASESVSSIVKGMSDMIIYGYQEYGTNKRYMILRSDQSIEAGTRFPYMKDKIPFGYEHLVKALNDAIDEEENNGGKVTEERTIEETVEIPFADLMAELQNTISTLMGKDAGNAEKIKAIVERYLGKGKKVSDCTEKQQEIVEFVLSELKDLL